MPQLPMPDAHSTAVTDRPLPLRRRPDLLVRAHSHGEGTRWIVKDPLALTFFEFNDSEYAILQMLDGQHSLAAIQRQFEEEFYPRRMTLLELQQFIGGLRAKGLVVSNLPGEGLRLIERGDERRRREWLQRLGNPLAIRFRGIDPQWLLDKLYPLVRWMFRPWAVAACMLFAISALLLIVVKWSVFQSRLPAFDQFFSLENAVYFGAALILSKILHEFGHGFACKHFAGECHQIGVLILVFMPCLYCDISDSYLVNSRWRRAAVAAAGMYVELLIAATCTWLWWFSEPGLLNHLCLSLMFVCSVSTVVFNGNPLLKYDGYYILSHLLDIRNLQQQSSLFLQQVAGKWLLGIEPPRERRLPTRHKGLFASYAVASFLYRWLVLLMILWFLMNALRPYRLEALGEAVALISVVAMIFPPLKVAWSFWKWGRMNTMKPKCVVISSAVFAGVGALMFVPLPYRVYCPLEIQPRDALPVYADVAGTLEKLEVKPGQQVTKGQPLAQLTNLDVLIRIQEVEAQRDKLKTRLENLLHQRFRNPQAAAQVSQAQEDVASAEKQLNQLQQDANRLTLTAPSSGTVILPPRIAPPKSNSGNSPNGGKLHDGKLPAWHGTPFEPRNARCFLEQGALFCLVGRPSHLEAVLVVDQADVEFLQTGQEVDLRLEAWPGKTMRASMDELSQRQLETAPMSLTNKAGGEVITKTDASRQEKPQSTSYQGKVYLDLPGENIPAGLRGEAKIYVGSLSTAGRVWRFALRTFRFRA